MNMVPGWWQCSLAASYLRKRKLTGRAEEYLNQFVVSIKHTRLIDRREFSAANAEGQTSIFAA